MYDFASTISNLPVEKSQGCKQAQKGKGNPIILVGKTREKIPGFGRVPDPEYLLQVVVGQVVELLDDPCECEKSPIYSY